MQEALSKTLSSFRGSKKRGILSIKPRKKAKNLFWKRRKIRPITDRVLYMKCHIRFSESGGDFIEETYIK
jgi:hypothetical protein